MINGIQIKVCGLTSPGDAALAMRLGADYLGFNLYPRSPRGLTLSQFQAMAPELSVWKKVAVVVEPTAVELNRIMAAGFDFAQVHFRSDSPQAMVAAWSQAIGADRLWLAPKLPPENDVPADLLPLAGTWLFDAFDVSKFGGSGRTSDWEKFRRHQEAHPEKTWILAGGLSPDNIQAALRATGARFVDANSGVEAAPGIKDPAKLAAFAAALAAPPSA